VLALGLETFSLLRICRNLTRVGERIACGETKNKEGREITLTARAVEALRAHRRQQLEDRLELDGLWHEHGLVFTAQRWT